MCAWELYCVYCIVFNECNCVCVSCVHLYFEHEGTHLLLSHVGIPILRSEAGAQLAHSCRCFSTGSMPHGSVYGGWLCTQEPSRSVERPTVPNTQQNSGCPVLRLFANGSRAASALYGAMLGAHERMVKWLMHKATDP